jgi:hypothetical protein
MVAGSRQRDRLADWSSVITKLWLWHQKISANFRSVNINSQTSVHERLASWTIQFTNKFSVHKTSRMTTVSSASAIVVEEWSSGKYPESATPIGKSVSCCVVFIHSNSLCLLLYFSVVFFYKLLNRTPWGQIKTMIAATWTEKIQIAW